MKWIPQWPQWCHVDPCSTSLSLAFQSVSVGSAQALENMKSRRASNSLCGALGVSDVSTVPIRWWLTPASGIPFGDVKVDPSLVRTKLIHYELFIVTTRTIKDYKGSLKQAGRHIYFSTLSSGFRPTKSCKLPMYSRSTMRNPHTNRLYSLCNFHFL